MLSLEMSETVSSVSCTALSIAPALIFNLFFSPPPPRIKSYNPDTGKTLGHNKVWLQVLQLGWEYLLPGMCYTKTNSSHILKLGPRS